MVHKKKWKSEEDFTSGKLHVRDSLSRHVYKAAPASIPIWAKNESKERKRERERAREIQRKKKRERERDDEGRWT